MELQLITRCFECVTVARLCVKQDNVRTNTESVQCHHVFDTAYVAPALRSDVIDYVTNRFAIGQFLLVVHWN